MSQAGTVGNGRDVLAKVVSILVVALELQPCNYVLDDDRMKSGGAIFGKDYFRELLERVRSIRASERRIWQQITAIYAECSIDYDRAAPTTKDFYAMIRNKFHYAISGKTAAEIVYERADRTKENMGLTTWKNSPEGRILKPFRHKFLKIVKS